MREILVWRWDYPIGSRESDMGGFECEDVMRDEIV